MAVLGEVHGNSGYFFRFDPGNVRIDILACITSFPPKRSGMFDQFNRGYLSFSLGPDERTLHHLTGGSVYVDGGRLNGKESPAKGESRGAVGRHI